MSEMEAAELFNRELDALLRDGRPPFPSHDEALIAAASSIVSADFSDDSRIREELRSRLTGEDGTSGFFALAAESFVAGTFKVVFAAACLLLLVTQAVRRPPHPPAVTGATASSARPAGGVPVPGRHLPPSTRVTPRPGPAAPPSSGGPVFASIPMCAPRGEPLEAFPIVSAGAGSPIVIAEAKEREVDGGTDLVMETEAAVLIIERRATSHEELFERRVI